MTDEFICTLLVISIVFGFTAAIIIAVLRMEKNDRYW